MSRDVVIKYLTEMARVGASDLYLTIGSKPLMRLDNDLLPIGEDTLTSHMIHSLLPAILNEQQIAEFNEVFELNTALDLGPNGRFRVNVLMQKHAPALVIRRITTKIPRFDNLRLPSVYGELALAKRGLVLVAGMTGSGKSTSLASMIDYRNRQTSGHIITIEDPIEFYHEHQKSIVTQREVGVDTHSYKDALRNALRQRPDVILVGEIRDREVMEQVIACSETGHLCLATVHANNAYQAIERVVNFFPEEQTAQVRMSLAGNLRGVLSQRLVVSKQGGAVPALEILLNQGLVRDLIAKGEVKKIVDVMEKNAMMGMRSFDMSLIELYRNGIIDERAAIEHADRPSELKVKLQSVNLSMQQLQHQQNAAPSINPDQPGKSAEEKEKEDVLLEYIDTTSLRLHD